MGVPKTIAMTLTVPELVSLHNIPKLTKAVINGPSKHPGARFIIHPDGSRIDLRFFRDAPQLKLKPGMIVERHLRDGDTVLFNRQPSLHKVCALSRTVVLSVNSGPAQPGRQCRAF